MIQELKTGGEQIYMKPDYIQLPPIPSDMPAELIEIVWGFARMEELERKKFLDFM